MSSDDHRCQWCGTDPQYVAYHDEEWGVAIRDDTDLFVKLTLDTFQSGLSWLVVLRKRSAILEVMDGLEPGNLVRWNAARIEAAMGDARIIRNRAKIESAVHNAGVVIDLANAGRPLSTILWDHVDGQTLVNHWERSAEVPDLTPESTSMARELKSLGFKWTGPTVCYAFMQAVGMVNDHLTSCFRHPACGRNQS